MQLNSPHSLKYTLDFDVPGFVTEGATLERLRERALAVVPELIADNAHRIDADRREGPMPFGW